MPRQGQNGFDQQDPLGCDLLFTDDLDAAHRLESGTSLVAHDIFHRWLCPRGRLLDDPDYGFGLMFELLNKPHSRRDLLVLPKRLESEARKDPRVDDISVSFEQLDTYVFRIRAKGTCGGGAPFTLVADISSAYQLIVEAA